MGVPRFLIGSLAGTLAAPIVLLAACGGDDAPIADPPVSPRPTSSSPTGTPPQESPEAFIRRWAEAEKRMENTGRTRHYRVLSQGCGPCEKLAAQVHGYYDVGGFVHWKGWKILSIKRYPGRPTPLFEVHSDSRPTVYKTAASAPRQHFSGGPITYVLALKRTANSWIVTDKSELSS
jgi:hypothetical protein